MHGKVNLAEKLASFDEPWVPKVVGELNDQYVKLVKFEDEYLWHHHQNEEELFLLPGQLRSSGAALSPTLSAPRNYRGLTADSSSFLAPFDIQAVLHDPSTLLAVVSRAAIHLSNTGIELQSVVEWHRALSAAIPRSTAPPTIASAAPVRGLVQRE